MDYDVKRLSDYSDESLFDELRRVAKILGKEIGQEGPSVREFDQYSKTSSNTIRRRFGSWNSFLRKAGFLINQDINTSDEELFAEIEKVWNKLGRQPSYREMNRFGNFSAKRYASRFGSWIKALEEFTRRKKDAANERTGKPLEDLEKINPSILIETGQKTRKAKKVEYGEPIDFLGLRHAPINEQGVVYLFGMLSRQLGFIIEAVRVDFPDCEGKRQIPGKKDRWERVNIEFEFKSSHFKEHNHNPNECDVIVCWEHDWQECPIEAISLKEIMKKIEK